MEGEPWKQGIAVLDIVFRFWHRQHRIPNRCRQSAGVSLRLQTGCSAACFKLTVQKLLLHGDLVFGSEDADMLADSRFLGVVLYKDGISRRSRVVNPRVVLSSPGQLSAAAGSFNGAVGGSDCDMLV
jgi:hypothetical protein